jgi:hypothetical protein
MERPPMFTFGSMDALPKEIYIIISIEILAQLLKEIEKKSKTYIKTQTYQDS